MEPDMGPLVESFAENLKRFQNAVEIMDARREELPLAPTDKARWANMVNIMASRKGDHDELVQQFTAIVQQLHGQHAQREKELGELQIERSALSAEKMRLQEQQALVGQQRTSLQAERNAFAADNQQIQIQHEKASLETISSAVQSLGGSMEKVVSSMATHFDNAFLGMRQDLTGNLAAKLDGITQKLDLDDRQKSSYEAAVNALKEEHKDVVTKAQNIFFEKSKRLESKIRGLEEDNVRLSQNLRIVQADSKRKMQPEPRPLYDMFPTPKRRKVESEVDPPEDWNTRGFDEIWHSVNVTMGWLHPRLVVGSPVNYHVVIREVVPCLADMLSQGRVTDFLNYYEQTNWVCFAAVSARGHRDPDVAAGYCSCPEDRKKCFAVRRWVTHATSQGMVEFDYRPRME